MMKLKTKTYTPTNFRKHIYDLLDKVTDNKEDIQLTVRPKGSKPNKNAFLISQKRLEAFQGQQKQVQKLINENRKLKENIMAYEIDSYARKLSPKAPTFTNSKEFEAWCERNDL